MDLLAVLCCRQPVPLALGLCRQDPLARLGPTRTSFIYLNILVWERNAVGSLIKASTETGGFHKRSRRKLPHGRRGGGGGGERRREDLGNWRWRRCGGVLQLPWGSFICEEGRRADVGHGEGKVRNWIRWICLEIRVENFEGRGVGEDGARLVHNRNPKDL